MILNSPYISGSLTVTGNTTLQGALTVTGSLSGTASTASFALTLGGTGSVGFATTGAFTATSGSASSRLTQIEQVYATTGSNSFRATQSITGSLTVTGQIIAQTLNVQQVTSSIVYSSGSNVFGCDINSRQTFTGSFYQTGSIASFSNNVGIGTNSPVQTTNYIFATTNGVDGSGYITKVNGTTSLYLYSNATDSRVAEQRALPLIFETSGTQRLSISAAGTSSFTANVLASAADAATITLKQNSTLPVNGIYLERSGERKGYYIYMGGSLDSLTFQRNNAGTKDDVLALTRDGNIGIGNTSPGTKLVVNNAIAGAMLPYINSTSLSYNSEGISVSGYNTSNTNIGNGVTFYNNVSSVGAYSPVLAFSSMTVGGAYNATYAFIGGVYQGAGGDNNWAKGDLLFGTGNSYGATERMRIAANGDFTIGNCSTASTKNVYWSEGAGEFQLNGGPGSNSVGNTGATLRIGNNTTSARRFWSLQLDGSNQLGTWYYAEGVGWSKLGYQTTGGTWTNSDERRKENIVTSNYGLNEILQLTPKKFNFKIDERKIENLGFIAQDVLPIIPEAVQSDEDDGQQYYAMNYANLVPVLVKAIQEQQCKIALLESCLGIS